MLIRRILLTTAILAGANAAMALTTPTYRGTVEWGDAAATDPTLDDVLHRWVRESMADAVREADELAATAEANGYPFEPVRHDIQHRLLFESPDFVSVLRQDYAYEGGASGSLWLVPVNWDAEADALVPVEALLGDPEADADAYARVADMLRAAIVQDFWNGEPEGWEGAIEAAVQGDPMSLSTFTFVPSSEDGRIGGVAWHFEPYVVAPGSEGVVSVVIPQERLRGIVQAEWHDDFAGEPADTRAARYIGPDDARLQALVGSF